MYHVENLWLRDVRAESSLLASINEEALFIVLISLQEF